MTAKRTVPLVGLALILVPPSVAAASTAVRPGWLSHQATPDRAEIGASVEVSASSRGRSTSPTPPVYGTPSLSPTSGATSLVYPTLRRNSSLLRDPTPAGPDTLWYQGGAGQSCIYIPAGTPRCFNITSPRAPAGQIRIDPAALAAEAASRLALVPGRIAASPLRPRGGLTGVPSWFWLEPAPSTQQTAASAGPETVTVTAAPTVEWQYGDGRVTARGSPRGYRPERVPDGATSHTYETRCLPGDRRGNPYVLDSCGGRGYPVEATVEWSISYVATGPVPASGALPSRTTTASTAYPVSEARAFLTSGGGR